MAPLVSTVLFLVHFHKVFFRFSAELATHSNAVFDITWKPGGEQIVSYSHYLCITLTVCKSVVALCRDGRDGTSEISRDPRTKCL